MIQLTEKYSPQTLDAFVGLRVPRTVFGAFLKTPYPSAWLLVGPAGTGKTQTAFSVARALGGDIHHMPSQACSVDALNRECEKCHYRPFVGDWHSIIIDEVDKISAQARLSLLSRLDGTAAPPDTIFFFTTNNINGLADTNGDGEKKNRFVSRCKVLNYTTPADQDMVEYLASIWQKETAAPPPDFTAIAKVADGNIRAALNTIETEILCPGAFVPPAAASQSIAIAEPARVAVHKDPKRVEASRRAWETMRKRRKAA